jgi:hypothetical protein
MTSMDVTDTRRREPIADRGWSLRRWLLVFALVLAAGHHVGEAFKGLGQVGDSGTRWADWIDLAVPYLVTGAAAAVLIRAGVDRLGCVLFAVGALVYTQGHGIHLAGNSVDNAAGGHVAHLWDEDVGHWIWYLGLTLLVTALVRALPPLGLSMWAAVGAALAGFTWFDNTVEGGVPYLGIAAAILVGGYAWRRRIAPVTAAYGLALVLLITWGIWQRGFPQFSQLGWI